MTGGKLGTAELIILRGTDCDQHLIAENERLRDALRVTVSALLFDDSCCARAALRTMARGLTDGGLASFVAELRAIPPTDHSGGGEGQGA